MSRDLNFSDLSILHASFFIMHVHRAQVIVKVAKYGQLNELSIFFTTVRLLDPFDSTIMYVGVYRQAYQGIS